MVDIQTATAESRRGKKKEERLGYVKVDDVQAKFDVFGKRPLTDKFSKCFPKGFMRT